MSGSPLRSSSGAARCEVSGHEAIVEGESSRPAGKGDGVQGEPPGGDACFELGGRIATAAESVEERVEGGGVEDCVRGLASEGLVET